MTAGSAVKHGINNIFQDNGENYCILRIELTNFSIGYT